MQHVRLFRAQLVWTLALAALGLPAFSDVPKSSDPKKIVIDGSTTVGPIAKAYAEYFRKRHPDVNITVAESGSGNGVKSLINATCDVASLSRSMTNAEFKAAVDKGEMPVLHAIAIDGIAIVVHPSNPVKALKLEQVRDIYTGKINNWKEVGGPDVKIVRISRDTNSGTYKSFEELVMHEDKMADDTEKVGSNGGEKQRVASTPAAIGYVGLGFLDRELKALSIEGIAPTPETVASGQYPIARPLFFATDGYPKLGTALNDFVTLHLTPDGQQMIEELGFVPITRCQNADEGKK